MFYLDLLIGLISSKKYWSVAINSVPTLNGVNQEKLSFYEILSKIQTKKERLNFLKP